MVKGGAEITVASQDDEFDCLLQHLHQVNRIMEVLPNTE